MGDILMGIALIVLAVLVFGFTAEMFGHAIGLQVIGYTVGGILVIFGLLGIYSGFKNPR